MRKGLGVAAAIAAAGGIAITIPMVASAAPVKPATPMDGIQHIVVIYEENHSFDNLYGSWAPVNGQKVNGLASAPAGKMAQVDQNGAGMSCYMQNDVNFTTPPMTTVCSGSMPTGKGYTSGFGSGLYSIQSVLPDTSTTCPNPLQYYPNGMQNGSGLPGGCTEDLVHRYYQEQYQINAGAMNRYVTGSDALGLTMGNYNTTTLPVYQYLHSASAPKYVVADNFFQSAFGGSFLNHQWLVSAQTPVFAGAVSDGGAQDLHSAVDPAGMPKSYSMYQAPSYVRDNPLTEWCSVPAALKDTVPSVPAGIACGDYAINTIQPSYQPYSPGTASYKMLPPLTSSNIGDELSAKNVDWAWYSGGWDNADGRTTGSGWTNGSTSGVCADPMTIKGATWPNCANGSFQFHHQPFNYFATYAPGTPARAVHLLDETNFITSAQAGTLKSVSFVKPLGVNNEHPGYASEVNGSAHLVELLKAIETGPQAKSTMVIVTYDEFGGAWDHVPPPTAAGVADKWGPGTRIPALVITPAMLASGVDSTQYDTTSILATIEKKFGLAHLSSRDASVHDMWGSLTAGARGALPSAAASRKPTSA